MEEGEEELVVRWPVLRRGGHAQREAEAALRRPLLRGERCG